MNQYDEDDGACRPPCSDPLCPCAPKPGHGRWPTDGTTLETFTWEDES